MLLVSSVAFKTGLFDYHVRCYVALIFEAFPFAKSLKWDRETAQIVHMESVGVS